MSDDPSFFISQRTIPTFDMSRVEETQDEIFLEIEEILDTVALEGSCYGEAVVESDALSSTRFVLRVKPELRLLLLSQLQTAHRAYRVFRIRSHPDQRYLFSGDYLLRFAPEATEAQKREALSPFFESIEESCLVPNGIYEVPEELREDPLVTQAAIADRPFVIQAVPVFVTLPVAEEALEAAMHP